MGVNSEPLFALVDVNNFYVSCERAFNPHLEGKPVVVLSNNDGCAVSRSNEVKALGVKMAAPWFMLQDLAQQHGIIALSSNYTLYADMSNRVMTILRTYSPHVEVYSIDESFLDLSGMASQWPNMTQMGRAIKTQIQNWTALPVCVGIASTKTLAKMANHIAKKQPEFEGICDLSSMNPARIDNILSEIDVGEIWGIGRRISERLHAMGIASVQDLRETPSKAMREQFGVVVERTCNELRGISCIALETMTPPHQQIISSRSFGQRVNTLRELEEAVTLYVARATEKLRTQHAQCGALHVFVQTDRFKTDEPQYNNGRTIQLPSPSADLRVLNKAALWGLKKIFTPELRYKKAGVILMNLEPRKAMQGILFENGVSKQDSPALMNAMDAINKRYGRDTLRLGSSVGFGRWKARFDNKTFHYTTDWSELPKAF
ncbi:DNA polymerase V [Herbaspirillum sp. Sphag1AN]|uniref:Y-family DNA polymerase n=1 Tax=unclassified Herbaspirillum TaxID=2624150 RepID=UPI00160D1E60|nr:MULTISPECIES: Y-family DNA polymerase [unclassified Herbaspirillum]MBB3212671.1 DNA polymerase V [Herbaspirillum sp. Sphag1AN]MBB3245868.1 DNA polymerase V [Herbaspirillum sp. Sphag64]